MTQRILAQYIRDLSFENVFAQKGLAGDVQHEVGIQVGVSARKRGGESRYEVITKLTITDKSRGTSDALFVLEIEYAGLFQIEGLKEELLQPYLFIECPRMTFPYLRRIVSDVTRDGGFPPLYLDTIDFVALFREEVARRAQTGAGAPAVTQPL